MPKLKKPKGKGRWKPVATANAFCPTGKGGGIDPTCSPGKVGPSTRTTGGVAKRVNKAAAKIKAEPVTPPPPPKPDTPLHKPNVKADTNKDGVTDAARVGVGAFHVPPPPKIGRIPNLTPREREVEDKFISAYEADPDGVAGKYLGLAKKITKPGEPLTFGTDDAKHLADVWNHNDPAVQSSNRATLNVALHQTANAITKRAFVQHLDTLKPGDEVMVTVGGCGAGKGYAIGNVDEAKAIKSKVKAVWDSAGDQNATENPWLQQEAEKRGLKVNYLYVHADPRKSWADPERGVVKRAGDPKDGRMVDAKVFADSYAIGARNFKAFQEQNADNPNANFVVLENITKPRLLPAVPPEATQLDAKELARFAENVVLSGKVDTPSHVKRGALIGRRIWGDES